MPAAAAIARRLSLEAKAWDLEPNQAHASIGDPVSALDRAEEWRLAVETGDSAGAPRSLQSSASARPSRSDGSGKPSSVSSVGTASTGEAGSKRCCARTPGPRNASGTRRSYG
jgi:hypothetical protein